VGVAVVACLTTGCSTTGYQRAQKTAESLQATKVALRAADQQVVRTMATCKRMVQTPGADLRPLYEQLKQNVAAIERQAGTARWRANSYRKNANAYLAQWSQELSAIEDDNIRLQSSRRRSEVLAGFHGIERAAAATRQAYPPLLKELNGIVQSLGLDLTPSGVASVRVAHSRALERATALRGSIARLLRELDVVARALQPKAR
jgi:phage shock protein A